MNHLTEAQLQDLREKLETELASLETELAEHGQKESGGQWDATSSGLAGTEADPTDAADQIEELVTNVPLVSELSTRAHDVKDALAKMEAGTYGICETSKEEIPFDRLEANPAARTCIAHA